MDEPESDYQTYEGKRSSALQAISGDNEGEVPFSITNYVDATGNERGLEEDINELGYDQIYVEDDLVSPGTGLPLSSTDITNSEVALRSGNEPTSRLGKRRPYVFRQGRRNEPTFRLGKRGEPTFRLGKRREPGFRLGRRGEPTFRLGKRNEPTFRLGKRNEPTFRLGKRNEPTFRLGKRSEPTFRLG